ncbi:16S rRNA (cytosine(1402)-N(4))-methyltransferase RsmH [filamentous cyanobacterium LEGE 11480]|uniref:Ribosomal RNA small subunit methyltransferase H n=1 Tax=Romeriopsis navalis LEGE 11480 TaxID=2777977 RepID=A0A928Z2M5_9CYAN|nr:16S rRNA (cytosine(1402)-N(4))-methyltransferase RsmH [Romeriopsis navalis]MBE9030541.1 16S rRNA (cytosine(1402)-N(4))-methyltransferase RsmH [Romeriopsis navalis LEGE 11480]
MSEAAKSNAFHHVPVLPTETIAGLNLQPNGHYLDATVGGGGHSRLMLEAELTIRVTALDQDELALDAARQNLAEFGDRVTFEQTNFSQFVPGDRKFDGILADLGVSSAQLDIAERGFSFRNEAPLDMRMDQRQDLTAADIVNRWKEKALADAIYTYGEERLSRRIAQRIVTSRPLTTTKQLADVIWDCAPKGYRNGRIHPATRTFQALRICVNQELKVLEELIEKAPNWLNPGGRMVLISFHSLEDRITKHHMRNHPLLKVLTKKPIIPQPEESKANVRARSAKLRIAERIESGS